MKGITALILIVLASVAVPAATASAQAPMGSVSVPGNADTLFVAFLRHLRAKSYEIQRTDSTRRMVRFVTPASNGEATDARFSPMRDSTTIEAQGVRGGMAALIMGLSAVREMLAARDSTSAAKP